MGAEINEAENSKTTKPRISSLKRLEQNFRLIKNKKEDSVIKIINEIAVITIDFFIKRITME
jgi:hypothetical protein